MDKWNFELMNEFRGWWQIFEIVEQRRKIGQLDGMVFIIHSNERSHNKAHLHVTYKEKSAVIEIPTGNVIKSNLSSRQNMAAGAWVRQNNTMLIEKWNALTNGVRFPVL